MCSKSEKAAMLLAVVVLTAWGAGVSTAAEPARAEPAPAKAAPAAAEPGFVSLFNGKDLTGWDGDPKLWSVQGGVIRGETTPEKRAGGNTFLFWKGGQNKGILKNFVLKLKFRMVTDGNNSGVQFRSKEIRKWRAQGYQAEVENNPGKVGFLYDEARRGWLVNVGDIMEVTREDGKVKKTVVAHVADRDALIKAPYYKMKDWNEYEITCRGNHIMMKLNGYQTIELIDHDREQRTLEGYVALQIHAGRPMTVEFKDIRIKELGDHFGEALRLFNGKDLDGWTFSSDKLEDIWSVKQVKEGRLTYGVLANKGRPTGYIRTKKDYTSYVLRMQVRHLTGGNGGVLLRMVGEDKVWPRSIEAQGMRNNMGDIFNIGQFPMKTDPQRTRGRHTPKLHPSNEKPLKEWNEYEIVLDGGELTIKVNGLVQNTASECWVTPGKICLQSEGAQMEFRNIVLIPIVDKTKAKAATKTE